MARNLLSRLKFTPQGFTLIELLVVIAIIAILVAIVVVAINPAQRLRDATDRTASGNVRSAGGAISACVTSETAKGSSGLPYGDNGNSTATPYYAITDSGSSTLGCGNFTWMASAGRLYTSTTRPNGITIVNNDTSSTTPTKICLWATGSTNAGVTNYWVYTTAKQELVLTTTNPVTTNNCTTQ